MSQQYKQGDVVEDEYGNAFSVVHVNADNSLTLRSVVTKQEYTNVSTTVVSLLPGVSERG